MIALDRLKTVSLFAALPRSALRIVADRAVERRFATGDILFRAGDTAPGLLVVLEGKVRVVRKAADRAQVVHVERAGGTLGEVPVFSGGGYPATAFVLLERLSRRVRELVERLDRASLRPVSARLAEYLIGRADARHRAVIAIGMTQQQLAEELGTVREVVVRELQALRASGLLRALGSGRFEIVDATALRARAREGAGRGRKMKVERRDTADAT